MSERKTDPVTVEVVRNLLMSIAEEMNTVIIKSAYSTNIKERRDVATAILDPEGNMVAQVESLAALLGSLLTVVRYVYEKFGRDNIKEGDMFIANDPYHGGGNHLPDIVVCAPVFSGKVLAGWVANIAHHSDIGGKVPGSTSGDADSVFQEGIRIPLVRIYEAGRLNESLLDLILDNTRVPQERYGDLTAQMSSTRIGNERMQEAYRKYDSVLFDCMAELQDYSERRVHAAVAKLPDGEYIFTDYMDGCGSKYPDPINITVKITIKGDQITFDFTGTHEQIEAPINLPLPGLKADVFFAVKALMGPDIPSNEGINRALKIIVPEGCLLNAKEPSPIGVLIDCSQRVPDVIFGALAPIFPDRIQAAGNGACTTTILTGKGSVGTDTFFIFHEVIAGGGGASYGLDGLSGVQVNMTNTTNMPIEATELEFPHILARKYELLRDSGGAGEFRGGLGIERELELMGDKILYNGYGDRHRFHPWGLNGGMEGSAGAFFHVCGDEITQLSHKTTGLLLKKGDIIRIYSPGAGGYGDPKKRPVEKVLRDVMEKKVSPEAACKFYSVAIQIDDQGCPVLDEIETCKLRESNQ
jgi:N-methylhydantoinase B